jgi:MraZ protein
MTIPTRIRDELVQSCGGRLVMTASSEDRCLLIYPEPEWLSLLPQLQALSDLNPRSKRLKRIMIGYSSTLEVDANGRLLVPPTLREYAEMDKKVMLVGQVKKFEVWSEERWAAVLNDPAEGEMPDELLTLAL